MQVRFLVLVQSLESCRIVSSYLEGVPYLFDINFLYLMDGFLNSYTDYDGKWLLYTNLTKNS